MVATGSDEHVRNQFGRDGRTALVFLVLPSIWEVWNYSGDSSRRGSSAGMDHDQQLHQSIVDIAGCSRLDDENYKGRKHSVSVFVLHRLRVVN